MLAATPVEAPAEALTLDSCLRLAPSAIRNWPLAGAQGPPPGTRLERRERRTCRRYARRPEYSRWERRAFLPAGMSWPRMSTEIGPTDGRNAGIVLG